MAAPDRIVLCFSNEEKRLERTFQISQIIVGNRLALLEVI